jgi:hypothetical protein
MTNVTQTLRRWRESKGFDLPRIARELRKAARDTGEDVAAHHDLVKMIPQRGTRQPRPRERYRLLYLKIFKDIASGLAPGTEFTLRLAEVRCRGQSSHGVASPDNSPPQKWKVRPFGPVSRHRWPGGG